MIESLIYIKIDYEININNDSEESINNLMKDFLDIL